MTTKKNLSTIGKLGWIVLVIVLVIANYGHLAEFADGFIQGFNDALG